MKTFDTTKIRQDFPILQQMVYGKPLVYLDNAATTQKPVAVIESLKQFYLEDCSNIHRGVHCLSERATKAYEDTRQKICDFIHAASSHEIIFVRGTTEAINLVAHSFARKELKKGDEILISTMEHHSNIVPWQIVCEEKGAILRVIPINDHGEILMEEYEKFLSPKIKLISLVHVSNSLGTINPIKEMIRLAHRQNIPVMIDGAQAVPHLKLDMQELDCDFYAFSGHKLYGPTGVGILYGKNKFLESIPPYQGGGDMISSVTFEKTIYNKLPYKFEAGTPHIAGGIALGAAINYLGQLDWDALTSHENELGQYAVKILSEFPGLRFIGTARNKAPVVSFVLDSVHPHDIGTILDREGIAIRAGHHCTQPVMKRFNVPATARASFSFYNTKDEVDALFAALQKVRKVFPL